MKRKCLEVSRSYGRFHMLALAISLFILFSFNFLKGQSIDNELGGSAENVGFFIINSNGDTLFTCTGIGFIGIGTNDPRNYLDVNAPTGGEGISISRDGERKILMSIAGGGWGFIELDDGTAEGRVSINPYFSFYNKPDYKFGIGTSDPAANLHVKGEMGALFEGSNGSGTIPTEGPGTRMMWYPNKSAFRVGGVDAAQWDDSNIGSYSIAMGDNTEASGHYSTASGYNTTAEGFGSVAMGLSSEASGYASIAMGHGCHASGDHSTSLGHGTYASGPYSAAMGWGTESSGTTSIATGLNTEASGYASTGMGHNTEASGDYSTSMGDNVEITGEGSFIVGDREVNRMVRSTPNRFFARFKNGYALYTNYDGTAGVEMGNNANSWSSVSDSTKKEKFCPVDGELVLNKISNFRLGSWNYKKQDPTKYRHYGPMAQDFYAAFGHDGIGTIGNDTTLASADFDGVNFIAIQALEKRTTQLQKENQMLKEEIEQLKKLLVEKLSLEGNNSHLVQK